MARRSADWNEGLAKDLKDVKFAQGFIQASLEEGLPIQVVLGKVIRAYGVKDFAARVKLPSSKLRLCSCSKLSPKNSVISRSSDRHFRASVHPGWLPLEADQLTALFVSSFCSGLARTLIRGEPPGASLS